MHRRLLGTALAAALLLGGCSVDPEPRVADPEPTEASSSVADSATPSEMVEPPAPSDIAARNDRGARAFVRYWVAVVNYAQATGNVGELDAISDERCVACGGLLEAISEPYSRGGRIEGGEWSIGRLSELPPDYSADWGAYAEARASRQVVVGSDGERQRFDAGPFGLYAYLSWTDDGWKMRWLRTPY